MTADCGLMAMYSLSRSMNCKPPIFDPSIANLFFSENAANAEVMGLEGDVTYLPANIKGLTVTGAFSFLDSEVKEVLVPTEDVEKRRIAGLCPRSSAQCARAL